MDWKRPLHRAALSLERGVDSAWRGLKQRAGWVGPPEVVPFRGHGTETRVRLMGRVLEERGVQDPAEDDSRWDNLVRMVKFYKSVDVRGARVRGHLGRRSVEVTSDHDGYFTLRFEDFGRLEPDGPWHPVALELLAPRAAASCWQGNVLIPTPAAQIGIISDIDDTIVRTGATSFLRMARVVMLNNAWTRVPFPGVAAFYRALERATGDVPVNPIFYVSSSPWNLYDVFIGFMEHHGIPLGPLFLKDFGIDETKFFKSSHLVHKRSSILEILDTHERLPFLLIGDTGQHDAEIYASIAVERPGRIAAVYLRDVGERYRHRGVAAALTRLEETGIDCLVTQGTTRPAEHAAARGWIAPATLPEIRGERQRDAAGGV